MSNTDFCVNIIKNNSTFDGLIEDVDYLKVYSELGFCNGLVKEKHFHHIQKHYIMILHESGLLRKIWMELQEKGINPLDHYFWNMEYDLIRFIFALDSFPLYVPFDKRTMPYLKKIISDNYNQDPNRDIANLIWFSNKFSILLDSNELLNYKTVNKNFPHLTHKIDMRRIQQNICRKASN